MLNKHNGYDMDKIFEHMKSLIITQPNSDIKYCIGILSSNMKSIVFRYFTEEESIADDIIASLNVATGCTIFVYDNDDINASDYDYVFINKLTNAMITRITFLKVIVHSNDNDHIIYSVG